jgi:hypothetical protein
MKTTTIPTMSTPFMTHILNQTLPPIFPLLPSQISYQHTLPPISPETKLTHTLTTTHKTLPIHKPTTTIHKPNANQYTHTYQHQPQPPPNYPPQNPGHDEAGQRHHVEPPGRTRGEDFQFDRGQYHRGDRNNGLDREAQFYKSIAKAPKMDFPKFDGSNPQEWLRMTKKYFDMVFVPKDAKFDYAQMYITGKADTWL